MTDAVQIAVVGHTNVGKTSLLRTLTRQRNFGEVSDRPGTTRHVEARDLKVDGQSMVRFFDTPGLEDSVALHAYLAELEGHPSPADRVRAFLRGPEADASFEQEAKVLRKLIEVDAAIYVIDAREPVLPKYRAEIETLTGCARPVMPVLNFTREAGGRVEAWTAALRDHNLHALVVFDVVAPPVGAEESLYQSLATLLPQRKPQLLAVIEDLANQRRERRAAACTLTADLLVSLAALRKSIPASEFEDPTLRQKHIAALRERTLQLARTSLDDLLAVYGFNKEDAEDAILPALDGRWEDDLFNPEVLRDASIRLGTGAAVGGAVGLAADVALAGMSLGAATALGAAIGGALSQGWSQLGRRIVNKAQGVQDLTLENEVLYVAAVHGISLLAALEHRGHAATQRIALREVAPAVKEDLETLVLALQPARAHPDWASQKGTRTSALASRENLVRAVAQRLDAAAAEWPAAHSA